MIILYIPFHENNDLIARAIDWKNTLTDQNILILQHGNPIDYNLLNQEQLTIYILAHGVNQLLEHFHLSSHYPITSQTTYLSIDQIADRFNSDFVYLHFRIKNIKLYFCNNQGNQKDIAELFYKNLVLFDASINYYAGTVFSPSKNHKKYSFFHGQWYCCSNVRNSLRIKTCLDSDEKLNIKTLTILNFVSDAKQKRIDEVFQSRKKARHEQLMRMRKKETKHQEQNSDAIKNIENDNFLSFGSQQKY
ncbi:hypothetical protein DGG96_17695 [Legionella qingyii]|uniref:RNA binding protein (Contains ribosomal protein S1 domain) n=1 Tax=Legionella qingyii TaxID=2184757 RepID=A0A317TZC2_9GAMM|nr:hypothetical protein [Legionella qingyii]PWY54285.1 hypothetical protein DGG96_17695 [Legionella qingyii]RUR23581.1 hypothetical protein ELY16_13030 [Legionella qingyii]RUR24060.1 hypothetical protein ELY20_05710 [Legionella qingyii]